MCGLCIHVKAVSPTLPFLSNTGTGSRALVFHLRDFRQGVWELGLQPVHREREEQQGRARLQKKLCSIERKSANSNGLGGVFPRTGQGTRGACGISSSQATCLPTNNSKNTAGEAIEWAWSWNQVRHGARDCNHELLHVMGSMSSETRHHSSGLYVN